MGYRGELIMNAGGTSPCTPARAPLPRDALGVGLRPAFYPELSSEALPLDYFEIISENYLRPDGPPRRALARVAARYPVVLHGVSLNLLGHEPIDAAYVEQVRALAEAVDAGFVTDHLCWTGSQGVSHHDLLPTPYVPELVELAAARAADVQRRLGRPFGLENVSSYVTFGASTMPEWEFHARVVRDAGCWFMLDINNIYVSSQNHGFDARRYIEAIDFSRVLQVHLAGHTRQADGTIVDTHDQPVHDAVWRLYRDAWTLAGPFPTLIEWDAAIPPLGEVLREVESARRVRRGERARA
jgi:uncharacterized protein (UPF0276 family)